VHCKEWECIIENFIEEEADTTVHQIYGQRATLSVNYKPGDWDSVRAWILKAGSGWHQAETAEDQQNMNKFAAGSPGAVTTHHIKWILSGRSTVEQMRKWQQALQAEHIMDKGTKLLFVVIKAIIIITTLGPRGSLHYEHFKSLN